MKKDLYDGIFKLGCQNWQFTGNMRIKDIYIKGAGGIRDLHIKFNDSMNILCGPNSIGKTTVIESVASMFMYGNPSVKRHVGCEEGVINANVEIDGNVMNGGFKLTKFNPFEDETVNTFSNQSFKLLSIKVDRNFKYSKLGAIPSDKDRVIPETWSEARNGVKYEEVKGWIVNRFLFSAQPDSLEPQQISNYELAKKCFSIINPAYSFSRVLAASNDIMVNTPQGEIYYEYLSSGFKSILSILFKIIKEIEFRFKEHRMKAEDFDGIILIDEVEEHLHPEWQEKILRVLRETFQNAQFIVTTHSPHVIQASEPNEIIALYLDDNNNVAVRRDISTSKYGFKGWTVEEILYDVMGMKTLRTELYHQMYDDFGKAIDEEDVDKAKAIYEELDQLLHPTSSQRKLLKFQIAKISES